MILQDIPKSKVCWY